MKYIVSVNAQDNNGQSNANYSLAVEAPNVVTALDVAKEQLLKTVDASGLQVKA